MSGFILNPSLFFLNTFFIENLLYRWDEEEKIFFSFIFEVEKGAEGISIKVNNSNRLKIVVSPKIMIHHR